MSEKNFRISTGLELGRFNNIVFGTGQLDPTLNVAQGGALQFNYANLATEQYVTDAIANISIPDAYITSIGQSSPFLNVSQGVLNLQLGAGLAVDYSMNGLKLNLDGNGGFEYDPASGGLKVKASNGISVNDNGVAVDTSYVANAIAGSGLVNNQGFLNVALGNYMTTDNAGITVDGYSLFSAWGQGNGGIYLDGPSGLAVNASWIANAIAGSGIVNNNGMLDVDTTTIATKAYADSIAAGLDIKTAVHLATSENVTIGNVLYAGNTFDNHLLADGDRILVKDQTNSYENGIYVVSFTGASRATDADSWAELNKGSFVFVESGTHAGHGFVVTTATTGEAFGQQGSSIEFTQFSDAGSYITSISQGSPFLTVNNNALNLELGGSLRDESGYLSVNLISVAGSLAGYGLTDSQNGYINVNTEYVANAIAGSGLSVDYATNGLKVKTDGMSITNSPVDGSLQVQTKQSGYLGVDTEGVYVDTFSLFTSVNGNGIYGIEGSLNINTDYVSNALAGSGLTAMNGNLNLNYGVAASNLVGYGLKAEQGTLAVNTETLANVLAGNGLEFSAVDNKIAAKVDNSTMSIDQNGALAVNTFTVGSSIGQNLAGTGINYSGTLDVNTSYVGQTIQGAGLTWNTINNTLAVMAGSNITVDALNGVSLADNVEIAQNLIVSGNLTVNGNTTTLNTTTLEVEDNLIVLNKNVTGTPSLNAGIEVERGTSTNASLYFDESADQWKANNGTTTVTIGDAYITSIGQASPFLSVAAGELNLGLSGGGGIIANPVDNQLAIDVRQGSGLLVNATEGLKVDLDAVGNSLEWQLMMAPTGKQAVTYVDGAGFVTDAPSQYGPKVLYDGSDLATSYGASIVNSVGRATLNTQTYSTVGIIPVSANSFDVYITMVDSNNSLARTSRVTGSIGSYTVEYTEYGIVEVGQSSILSADVKVEYDLAVDAYVISATGQGKAVADIKYTNVA